MSKKDFLNSLTDLCNNNITFIPNKKTEKVSENDKPDDKKETVEQPKSKKSKKKNKKSMVDDLHFYDEKLNIVSGEDIEMDEDNPDSTVFANGKTIADMIQYNLEHMDEAFSDDIILTERKRYKQKGKDDFEDDFSQVLALLYDNLKKTEQLDRDLDKLVKPALSSRTRQMSKYVTELISAKISNNSNSLSIIKEISATRKKIADLRMAEAKNNKQTDFGENNPDLIAGAFFDRISSMGRNNFMNSVNNAQDVDYQLVENDNYFDNTDDENLPDFDIDSVLAERDTGRSEEEELKIKFEKLNPKIVIIRDIEDGTWDFAALDKNGDTIEGYPLPDKNRVGRITFSYDGSTATDDQGQTYKVYEYEMDDEGYFDDTQDYDD